MIHQDIEKALCNVPYGLCSKITLILTSRMYDLLMLDLGKITIDRKLMTYYCGVPIKIIDGNKYQWFISIDGGEVEYETV